MRFIIWPIWFVGRVLTDLAFPGTIHTRPDFKSSQLHTESHEGPWREKWGRKSF